MRKMRCGPTEAAMKRDADTVAEYERANWQSVTASTASWYEIYFPRGLYQASLGSFPQNRYIDTIVHEVMKWQHGVSRGRERGEERERERDMKQNIGIYCTVNVLGNIGNLVHKLYAWLNSPVFVVGRLGNKSLDELVEADPDPTRKEKDSEYLYLVTLFVRRGLERPRGGYRFMVFVYARGGEGEPRRMPKSARGDEQEKRCVRSHFFLPPDNKRVMPAPPADWSTRANGAVRLAEAADDPIRVRADLTPTPPRSSSSLSHDSLVALRRRFRSRLRRS
ncbi:hypothetical protein ALC57_09386 [Trachymyrmex cornetzi]|uniref:Uncharacterized protein n=1 Tax=Trachymyrmex cornetzi TaxID=471704 RepID=A0A195E074_9HYME|nr:hypothetical protein ALC57_09386 [Trachymyrmex cornetzi]